MDDSRLVASFVRFCNVDNAHMNAHKMGLTELQRLSRTPLTILVPGEWIDRGKVIKNEAFAEHFARAQSATTVVTEREVHDISRRLTRRVAFNW